MRRTAPLADVRIVFVAEVADRREHRVRRRLPKAAKRTVLDSEAQLLEKFNVPFAPLALGDAHQDFVETFRAYVAVDALPAALFAVKSRKNRAMFTMHVRSSMTTMPPEPMIAPVAPSAL